MRSIVLAHEVDWGGFRTAARALALEGVAPEDVVWGVVRPTDLFATDATPAPDVAPTGTFTLPRGVVQLAETVIQSSDPVRFALLYTLIWRAHAGERHLLELTTDAEVQRAQRLAASVRRDTHKMRAFVRFRAVEDEGRTEYVSWFEPEHYIVEANADFFVRRFAGMHWSILTPYRCAHWDGEELHFTEGARREDVPDDDALEGYWRTYFSSIFNPARLKIGAMMSEMPKKYWKNLPEAAAIPELIRNAAGRTEDMVQDQPRNAPTAMPVAARQVIERRDAAAALPEDAPALAHQARAAAECRRCDLWQPATQVVFGEGPADARIMFVGEQPGDQEDLAGRPFVGPAGQLFDRAMAEAGLDRATVYVTNAVKHFKFVPRGKRRIHEKPGTVEIAACKVWLEGERDTVRPAVTVMMGATAARAVMGREVRITRERGQPVALPLADGGNATGLITVHPSYLLRLPDEAARAREYASFVGDLRLAAELAA